MHLLLPENIPHYDHQAILEARILASLYTKNVFQSNLEKEGFKG